VDVFAGMGKGQVLNMKTSTVAVRLAQEEDDDSIFKH